MGLFNFFKRKKKPDLDGLNNDLNTNSDLNYNQNSFSRQPSFQNPSTINNDSNELILTKLDLINAKLQAIEQRIANIERIAYESQEPKKRW